METLAAVSGSQYSKTGENSNEKYLTDYSPGDKPWDVHRAQADAVAEIYARADEFERYASRMSECSGVLRFAWVDDVETGESRLKLREARFCRVRHCPVCQWRRSLMWQARFYEALPRIMAAHPKSRWLFLTLTVRNCPITELGDTLTAMNSAWRRLVKRPEFKPVLGWVRTTEVTRGKDGSAHPHFHALLMVPPSYFKGSNYVRQARWTELWQECLRVDYMPIVHVTTVKPRKGANCDAASMLRGAVAEVLKYSVKPADMTGDDGWFLEMTRQTHKRRFVATGGVLKNVLRVEQETDDDLALTEGENDEAEEQNRARLAFNWRRADRRYKRYPKGDIQA